MKTAPSMQLRDVRAEARDWLMRLQSEDLSTEEIVGWETWIGEDVAHQVAYDAVSEAWALASMTEIRRPTALEMLRDEYNGAVPIRVWSRRRPPVRLAWAASVAAVAVLALGALGWTAWNAAGDEAARQFATGVAEHNQVMLSDGSDVRMAAMTDLQVDFDRGRRDIALKRGEALFKVAHDKSRPFVVATRQAEITAVGTAFDVHILPSETVVSVTEGVVRVVPAGGRAPVRVAAGHRLTASRAGVRIAEIGVDTLSSTPWLEGRLEYRNQPLSDVLQDVNRYARTQLVLGDAAAGRLDFTGTVQIASVEDWAHALPGVFPLRVENAGGKVVVRSQAKE